MTGKSISKGDKSQSKIDVFGPTVEDAWTKVEYWRERYNKVKGHFNNNTEIALLIEHDPLFDGYSNLQNITNLFKGRAGLDRTKRAVEILEQHVQTAPPSLLAHQGLVKK